MGADRDSDAWVDSSVCHDGRLSASQITQWREQGFTLVHDLLPVNLLKQVALSAAQAFPAANSQDAAAITDFGSDQRFVFPSQSQACNALTLHHNLLTAISALLDVAVEQLRLTQSDVWVKYGRPPGQADRDNADQRMHCDYPNHTLTHPPPWQHPEAVELIVYLADWQTCGGATAVVPRRGPADPAYPWPITQTPGVGDLAYVNDRDRAERYLATHAPDVARFRATHLYPREVQARYRFGSILFYRHDTWHRGTPVELGQRRIVANLTFRKADSEWVNVLHPGWSWSMYQVSQITEQLIAKATVAQRAVLGFPPPGSAYWTEQTITAVAQRYAAHGIDMSPYRKALA